MSERPDYSRSVGGAALAARLRRLAERMDRDSARLYAASGLRFEQRWFGVLNQLELNGPTTVGDIASALRITHVSVSQAKRSLEERGLVRTTLDKNDARVRRLGLTRAGRTFTERLQALWSAMSTSSEALNREAGNVVESLDRLDDALDARSLFDRVNDCISVTMATIHNR